VPVFQVRYTVQYFPEFLGNHGFGGSE
jgi:hypothetical protein